MFSPEHSLKCGWLQFLKIQCIKENGFLVTFCAKGEVKRRLKDVGFNLNHPIH